LDTTVLDIWSEQMKS